MKKILTAIITASMMLFSAVPLTGMAEDTSNYIEIDGVYYEPFVNNDTQIRLRGVADKHATSITIHNEVDGKQVVIYADQASFLECDKLETINVEGGKEDGWHSIDGVLFYGTGLVKYPPYRAGDYTIPEGTTGVKDTAFRFTSGLEKLTVGRDFSCNLDFSGGSMTEFDGRGMKGSVRLRFIGCSRLKSITLDGDITGDTSLQLLPELESLTFTPEATVQGTVSIDQCEKLKELRMAECADVGTLNITKCDALEYLSFYNGFLGLSQVKTVETELGTFPVYEKKAVCVDTCYALKEIEVLATPYVTSHDSIYIDHCPKFRRITFHETPQSAMRGEEPDLHYIPFYYFDASSITVIGREEHEALKVWCAANGHEFGALGDTAEPGDVNGDAVINASDAAMILKAAAERGASGKLHLSVIQKEAADVDGDTFICATDAAKILQYAAAHGSGAFKGTIKEFLSAR